MAITINPALTTNAAGLFATNSNGLVQGTAYDSPTIRNSLSGAVVDPTETYPMWGGVGIYENIPLLTAGSTTASSVFNGYAGRATSVTANAAKSLTGFSVFDQAYNGITTPQSTVPLFATGQTINLYRLGTGARIAVKCAPSMSSFDGGLITPLVSWDFVQQQLVPYSVAYAANTITNAVWASTSGGRTTFTVSTDPTSAIDAGDLINVSGVVNTGGSSTSAFNGSFVVVSTTSTTIVVTQAAAASVGTYSSGGTVAAGGGALVVKVLEIQIGGCKTVSYDATTGFATWSNDGNCAVIQI